MTTCVHCNKNREAHFKTIYEEMGEVHYRDCPIIKDGKRIGWHPTNRFKARSGEKIKQHMKATAKAFYPQRGTGYE